jgi:hypothetical protein
MIKLKRMHLHLIIFLVLWILIGCDTSSLESNGSVPENEPPGTAQIRFIHSASSASELDFAYRDITDNKLYLLHSETTYGHQYGYFSFYSGEREIRMCQSYSDIAVAVALATLEDDKKYLVIAYDYQATINPELMVLPDTLTTPESGVSFVRFIHTGADVSFIQIAEKDSNDVLVSLNHLANSGYFKMQARTYRFELRTTQEQTLILEVEPITFLSGQSYSIVFSGSISDLTAIDFNAKVYRETSL